MDIHARLMELQDAGYRDFQVKLLPTVDPGTIIGVRTPELRKLAREIAKTPEAAAFLAELPHATFEENNLHGFILSGMKDYGACLEAVDRFLPYVDNWATCDQMSPKVFGRHPQELLSEIRRWMASSHTYTIRFGVGMLMNHYLDEQFDPIQLEWVAGLRSEEYYVNMMIAWYFATALAKQYAAALPLIEGRRLAPWTHAKAIQKAVESCRVSEQHKQALRAMK